MGKLAFLFAGQGAQAPGMGKALYQRGGAARRVFEQMEAVRPGTMADCFEADAARLAQTDVTQPCVYTVDLACAAALVESGLAPQGAAGFSLGEVAALTFAGAFEPQDGARLVCERGRLMAAAAARHPGDMAAVLRLDDAAVEKLCADFQQVWPVNYNCPGQLVVAGATAEMPAFCEAVKAAGGMAKRLPVGGAFHTPMMAEAARDFAGLLQKTDVGEARMPVYANRTAAPYAPPYAETLAAQMHSPVRWHESILRMKADGYDTFAELGPGKTLTGFLRRIFPEAAVVDVDAALA